jgi:hypothetical protein
LTEGNIEEACFSPLGSPRVLDDPVVGTA